MVTVKKIDFQSLNEVFKSHSVCKVQHVLRKSQVLYAFPDYVNENSFDQWHLSLHRFAMQRPLLYIHREAVDKALAFFDKYRDLTVESVLTLQRELSHAIFSVLRPAGSWANERQLSIDKPEQMAELENIWHPEYQRYCEHVFNHLIQVPVYVIGAREGKNYLEQTLGNRAKLLHLNGLAVLTIGYDSVIRNAISHGNTAFDLTGVRYIDRKANQLLAAWEFSGLFDNLVDTCHSILVALLLFLCSNRPLVEGEGLEKLPLGLRFIFIDAFASHWGFELLSMTESNAIGMKKQLNIVCKIRSKARWVQLFEGMQACWNATIFGGHHYSRFFVAFDCGMPVLSSLILDGDRLQSAIKANEPLNQCVSKIIETSLLWYDARAWERKVYGWKCLLPIQWRITREEIIHDWRNRGFKVLSSRYAMRDIRNVSTESVRQVEGHIVLREKGLATDEILKNIVRHAVRRLRKHRVRKTDFQGEKGRAGKPGYIRIRLYAIDRRIRTLASYGWMNEELILIAEWMSSMRQIQPFYTQKADVILGNIRIKFNPGLVKASKPVLLR